MTRLVARYSILIFMGCYFSIASGQKPDSNQVFRLGTFDRSSGEFTQGAPNRAVKFDVGQSSMKDWYSLQPSESSTVASSKRVEGAKAPRAIEFQIANVPAAAYRMHVALLIEGSGVPALQLMINGKRGVFYLHPKLDYAVGDQTDPPDYSHADVEFIFPGTFLQKGTNTITMQAVEGLERKWDPKDTPTGSFNYDAIELDRAPHLGQPSALIVPTIFFEKQSEQTKELVDVYLHSDGPVPANAIVNFTLAGQHYQQTVVNSQDFGEQLVEFAVSEFSPGTLSVVRWSSAGHTQKLQQLIDPEKKWTLFLVPHIHLDVGYSDYQAKVAVIQSRAFDEAMDFTAKHPDFSFSTDGEWNLEQYMKTRTPAEQQRVITAIRNKQLFIPAQYANLLTGFSSTETLIRSLYPSANFSRIHGTPFNYANITDVPSYSWSYPSVLAAAGIHDFVAGMNSRNVRAPVLMQGHLNESSPMQWEGPDGGKVLFWYSRGYQQMRGLFDDPPAISAGAETLPLFLQQYKHPSYRANAVIIYGTQQENTDLFPQQAELAQTWNARYLYPRIQYSGYHDALEEIARQFGGDLPVIRGDGGPYWEDGSAADALYATMERNNEDRGPSAEKLQTISSLVDPRIAADKEDLDAMWSNMVLMDEHTWTSSDSVLNPLSTESVQQTKWKDSCALNARDLADWLTRSSMASIANWISVGPENILVFNTLAWPRSGLVETNLRKGYELVDAVTGERVPMQILRRDASISQVSFVASNIPAVGYKVFHLRRAQASVDSPKISQGTTMESPYYRVELDPESGAIKSIYDKETARELVNQNSPYHFGQYLYVTGGDKEPNSLLQYRPTWPQPNLDVHLAHGGHLESVERTPYGWSAHIRSTDTNTPAIDTELRLYEREKKIELIEDVDKQEVYSKEGVYFAFPFAMDHPQFQYEIQNGVVDPTKDMHAGAGHEWFSVQHWVSVQQDGFSGTVMPLDAPLITLGDINRGAWPTEFGKRPGTIFSYVMNNNWNTNFRAGQGGHFQFRYVITSARSTDSTALSRMGWEESTPLEHEIVTPQDKALNQPRPLSGMQGSFLEVPDDGLLFETWKPAEDGNGTVLRFLDLGKAERTVTVHLPLLQLHHVWLTDAVERNQAELHLVGTNGFDISVRPHQIITVRIEGETALPKPATTFSQTFPSPKGSR